MADAGTDGVTCVAYEQRIRCSRGGGGGGGGCYLCVCVMC